MSNLTQKDLETLIPLIDLTALNQTDSVQSNLELIELANQGIKGCFPAAVCLYPRYADLLLEHLNENIKSCVVSSYFPSSQAPLQLKLEEITYLNQTKIDEIDIMLPLGEFLDGNFSLVEKELTSIRENTNKTLKVILETGAMQSKEQIKEAAQIAIRSGADFIKTSTGKYKVGATLEAAIAMAEVIRDIYQTTGKKVGLKVAGGVGTIDEAKAYIEAVSTVLGQEWINPDYFRIGASRLYHKIKTTANA